MHVLTERRISSNRLDCCCCAVSGGPPVASAARVYTDAGASTGMCCGRKDDLAVSGTTITTANVSVAMAHVPTAIVLPGATYPVSGSGGAAAVPAPHVADGAATVGHLGARGPSKGPSKGALGQAPQQQEAPARDSEGASTEGSSEGRVRGVWGAEGCGVCGRGGAAECALC